jgi:hypothetical protein
MVRFGTFRTANDVSAHGVVPARWRHRPLALDEAAAIAGRRPYASRYGSFY